jgi:hypothetical protein
MEAAGSSEILVMSAVDKAKNINLDKDCGVSISLLGILVTVRHPPSLPQRSCNHWLAISCYTSDAKPEGQV